MLADALAQAVNRTNTIAWGSKADDATLYLAAHIATIMKNGSATPAGPVTSEAVGSVSRSYGVSLVAARENYASTVWGRMYLELRSTLFVPRVF